MNQPAAPAQSRRTAPTITLRDLVGALDGPTAAELAARLGQDPEWMQEYLTRFTPGIRCDDAGRWWPTEEPELRVGPVSHFKGGRYLALGVAADADSGLRYVIYRPAGPLDLNSEVDFYLRAEGGYHSSVVVDGQPVPRFNHDALRRRDRADVLSIAEDILAEGADDLAGSTGDHLFALRTVLQAQRESTISVLAKSVEDPGYRMLRAATATFLRLLDAAEREIHLAEEAIAARAIQAAQPHGSSCSR